MSTITEADMNKLLEEEKAYLGITWKDETTDSLLKSYIKTSIKRLESIFGDDLNFINGELLTLRNYGKVKQLMARKEGSEDANE